MCLHKKSGPSKNRMDTVAAVVDIVRENEEMRKALALYEEWFDGLVGRTITLSFKNKNKTRFTTCTIEEFDHDAGEWLARDNENDEVFSITFDNLIDTLLPCRARM